MKTQIHLAMRTAPWARPSCIKFCQPLLCLLFIYKRVLCNLARLSTPKWTIFWRLPSWIKLVPPQRKKNHSYLDSGTWNMDPPKRCWSGNVWKRVPLSNVDNFRSPPWSVENDLESMTTDMFFYFEDWRITNHQHKPALHFITGWNLQIIINPYISYFFLGGHSEVTFRAVQFSNPLQLLGLSLVLSQLLETPPGFSKEHLLATQRTKGANVLFSNSMECMAFG